MSYDTPTHSPLIRQARNFYTGHRKTIAMLEKDRTRARHQLDAVREQIRLVKLEARRYRERMLDLKAQLNDTINKGREY